MDNREITIIKVGGSILSLSEENIFDFNEVNKLKDVLFEHLDKRKYLLCIGGGFVCRKYQKLLRDKGYPDKDQHEVGVATINLNAVMMKSVFGNRADDRILRYADYDSDEPIIFERDIFVTAAGSPGHSSDWNTVKLAIRSNSKKIVSLKNIDGVYTADPKKDPAATKLDKVTWDEYINIIGNPSSFEPGGNYPVDIFAAKLAKETGKVFYIVKGDNFENMMNAINGEEFIGTIISD